MALVLLRRRVTKTSTTSWDVTEWVHDTIARRDTINSSQVSEPQATYNALPTVLLGTYCDGTTQVEVRHSAERDGTSKLTFNLNATACANNTGGGNNGGGPVDPNVGTQLKPANDPQAPPGAELLRRVRFQEIDGYSYTDKYYVPSLRNVIEILSAQNLQVVNNYTRPSTDLLDQYCVEQGEPPYTQIKVYHNGSGGVRRPETDNAQACLRLPCRLGLKVVPVFDAQSGGGEIPLPPALDEFTDVQLQSLFSLGQVLYSLDDYETSGRESGRYSLLPGRYKAKARETRANGCTASLAFQIKVDYGLRYKLPYCSREGEARELRISLPNYKGTVETLTGSGPNPVNIDYPGSRSHFFTEPLNGSAASVSVVLINKLQLRELFGIDERTVQVEYYRAGQLFWKGFVLPERYDRAHRNGKVEFNFEATDLLGTLSGLPFTDPVGNPLSGSMTLLEVIQHCLNRLDLELPLYVLDTLYHVGQSKLRCTLAQTSVDVAASYRDDKGKPLDCEKVLRYILEAKGARIMQRNGAWFFERYSDIKINESLTYFGFNADGESIAPLVITKPYVVIGLAPPNEDPENLYYVTGGQRLNDTAAVKRVTVAAEPGKLVNLLARGVRLLVTDFDTAGRPIGWTGVAPVSRVVPVKESDPPALKLQGLEPGIPFTSALWIQTPLSLPVSTNLNAPLRLRFYVTVRTVDPMPQPDPLVVYPELRVAVRQGDVWLWAGNNGESATQVITSPATLMEKDKRLYFEIVGYGRGVNDPGALSVRFYQVAAVAGHSRYDVEIDSIELVLAKAGTEEDYTDQYIEEQPARFTRTDDAITLLHTDTIRARLKGTLYSGGLPTYGWYEQRNSALIQELGFYVAKDRVLYQYAASSVLRGTVRGNLTPGLLFTDPQEQTPKVYFISSARLSDHDNTWEIICIQDLTQFPPGRVLPDYGLLTEDNLPILSQEGGYLLAEYAQ